MDDIVSCISQGFTFLNSFQIMGVSFFWWLIAGVIFTLIGAFIRGKK